MEVLDNIFNSLKYYFNALTQFGYKKQSDVNKLLIYNFIGELLTGDMRVFVTEDDYKLIEQALTCLYGSTCLIPYPKYINNDTLYGNMFSDGILSIRITEDSNIRTTEDAKVRFKASNYDK